MYIKENDGQHIHDIMGRTDCPRHNKSEGYPCFTIEPSAVDVIGTMAGLCNSRVLRAGYNGAISPVSLPGGRNKSAPTKRNPKPRTGRK